MIPFQKKIIGFKCIKCGTEHSVKPFQYSCNECGNNLDVIYDYGSIREMWSREELAKNPDSSIWRYLPLLPVQEVPANHSINVGGTPLLSFKHLSSEFGIQNLWIKDDTRNPSGSLKDRASEIGLKHADELGADTLVVASTGNAAASLASLSAFYKKRAVILTPALAPEAKLTQILQYGADLIPVEGSYDDAFNLSLEIVERFGWYLRSTGINPMLSEGKKTVALEIAEQLNWRAPDKVFVPVGDGCIIGGVYKGFYDLLQLGWIERLPQIIAVQAEGSAAIVRALGQDGQIEKVKAETIADSISVNFPRDGSKAVRAVQESHGFGITVTDEEILDAQKKLASLSGIFAEPAAAATFAGFLKSVQQEALSDHENIVLLITGTGLKDISAAQKKISIPFSIEPDLDAFEKRIGVEW